MKRLTPGSDHNAEGNGDKVTVTTTEPFAENRYRKYRFQRDSIVLQAPESSGVYGLYSALWIYIGECDNIRARLLEHLAGDNPCISLRQPSGFAFELVCPEHRRRRKEELIKKLEPFCKEELSHIGPSDNAGSGVGVSVPSIDSPALCDEPKLSRVSGK
jgi:hypothetical protein